ncbi:MAG: alpha-1,2-fucosyltransferase, partial [Chloroflexia bacterium]|nr:alpha-1,2-fucosyltransferase [Chloroflexia bacterium]
MRLNPQPQQQPKVIVRILGGLGNQLFGYAAARQLALANNAELIIDHISGFRYDTQYQRHYQLDHFAIPCRKATPAERLEPFARPRRYLLRRWNQRRPFEQRRYLTHEFIDFDERLLHYRLTSGPIYLEGYWQSEGYFKDVEPQIRQDLRIHPPTDAPNLAIAERIRSGTAVAVHVRFFDEPSGATDARDNNAPGDYYQRAIQTMEAQVRNAHYFLFSDLPEAARSRIPLPDDRIPLVHHNQGDENAYA